MKWREMRSKVAAGGHFVTKFQQQKKRSKVISVIQMAILFNKKESCILI